MRYPDEDYEFKATIRFIDENEAYYFSRLLESLSDFLDDYIKFFGGDEEISQILWEVCTQIREQIDNANTDFLLEGIEE